MRCEDKTLISFPLGSTAPHTIRRLLSNLWTLGCLGTLALNGIILFVFPAVLKSLGKTTSFSFTDTSLQSDRTLSRNGFVSRGARACGDILDRIHFLPLEMAPSTLITAGSLHWQGGEMSSFLMRYILHQTFKAGQVNCIQKQFLSFGIREAKETSAEADICIPVTLGVMNPTWGICLLTLVGLKKFLLLFR